MIELLNIAGTGPIFGALMGAKWGPVALLWIIIGSIVGGAVHDYMSGMMAVRNEGKSLPKNVQTYLGDKFRYVIIILVLVVLIVSSAMLARSACDLLVYITDVPMGFWLALITMYFVASALLPIDKLIGKIYPVFGILLVAMAVMIIVGLVVGGFGFPAMTLENLHPQGAHMFPDMCITIACGAISGFHATQSTMVSRCIKDEKDGRIVFYGAMIVEAFIALIWVIAGLSFYPDTASLSDALAEWGAAGVVYDISTSLLGTFGGVIAVLGVVVCPITSGDTAIRAIRLLIQDDRGYDSKDKRIAIGITLVAAFIMIALCLLDFQSLWYYMSWLNQTLACFTLWTCTAFLLKVTKRRIYSLITAIPAMFMTLVVSSFIMNWSRGLNLDYEIAMVIGAIVTIVLAFFYLRAYMSAEPVKEQYSGQ
jgi:carbon starvation protein CstA